LGVVAKSALAGLLALLLLVSATLALSSVHRNSHQANRAGAGHPCVFCLFTNGQITVADVSPPLVHGCALPTGLVSLPRSASPAAADYRLPPSRAPPASFSNLAVG